MKQVVGKKKRKKWKESSETKKKKITKGLPRAEF